MKLSIYGKDVLIDDEDYERVSKLTWYVSSNGYASSGNWDKETKKTRHITMHRFILDSPKGRSIDHINGNKLDNRKENLRIVTHQQNMFNIKKKSKAKSVYKGLSWLKNDNVWRVRLKHNYKEHYVGRFFDEIDAAHAYDKYALELFGEFAGLNFPDFDYTNYEINRIPTYNNRKVKSLSELRKEKEGE